MKEDEMDERIEELIDEKLDEFLEGEEAESKLEKRIEQKVEEKVQESSESDETGLLEDLSRKEVGRRDFLKTLGLGASGLAVASSGLAATLNQGSTVRGGHLIWNENNDGSGSGLDADTVDGQEASEIGGGEVNTTKDNVSDGTLYVKDQKIGIAPEGVQVQKVTEQSQRNSTTGSTTFNIIDLNRSATVTKWGFTANATSNGMSSALMYGPGGKVTGSPGRTFAYNFSYQTNVGSYYTNLDFSMHLGTRNTNGIDIDVTGFVYTKESATLKTYITLT